MSVTATNGCGTSAPLNLSGNCRIIGISNIDTKVFPNPTTGLITVEFNSFEGGDHLLKVADISGRIIFEESVAAVSGLNRFDIDLSIYNVGLYMLYVTDKNGNISITKISVE
jgi:hypothetical protein